MFLDRWFHIIDFVSNHPFSACWTSSISPFIVSPFYSSNHYSRFCSLAIFLPTWPNSNLFQETSLFRQLSKWFSNWQPPNLNKPSCQASWKTSSHLGSRSHLALKQNNFLPFWVCYLSYGKCKTSKEWSKEDMEIWYSLELGNFAIHSLFASAQSNRTHILPSSLLFFDQVNGEHTKPKSWKHTNLWSFWICPSV